MYSNMMDPELMRLAQEQMSRIPPEELAKIQQQMMSNPELLKFATESMKNLKPEDVKHAAEQMKHSRTEDMVKVTEKLANATPDEIASMKSFSDAQVSYQLNAAKLLKQKMGSALVCLGICSVKSGILSNAGITYIDVAKLVSLPLSQLLFQNLKNHGNELHSQGQYHDAAKNYLLAKNNLKDIPSSMGGMLQLQCSLNLMSCYLKTNQFEVCIKEGSEVLACESRNVKALYRRGQAYKELGNLEAAVCDLRNAHEISRDDETIADVLRDANEKLMKEGGDRNVRKDLVIGEILEEENKCNPSENHTNSPAEYSVTPQVEVVECSQDVDRSYPSTSADERLKRFSDNPETIRLFQNYISNADPSSPEALGLQGISPDTIKSVTDTFSKMKPEELQKMFETASSFNGKGPGDSMLGSQVPEMNPEMVKMASETISKMSPEEFQKMLKVASSLTANQTPPLATTNGSAQISENGFQSDIGSSSRLQSDIGERNFEDAFLSSRMGQSSSSIPTSMDDLQANMQNSMRDPAMRQMFATMMKNMSPEMMANMSKQFGMNLSKEDAAKAQQAMSEFSPEDLDRMMRWMERAQRGVETAKKTKNWLLGRPGMILAIVMLILAFILHQLGFISG